MTACLDSSSKRGGHVFLVDPIALKLRRTTSGLGLRADANYFRILHLPDSPLARLMGTGPPPL